MAKENMDTNKSTGDVDNIRKILFGDQISQIEERFNQNENAISQLRTENRNLRQVLEAEVTMRENMDQELRNLLESFQKDENDAWKNNVSAQEKLISTLEKALNQFKSDITVLPK
jgi:predicted RNase H-like nuclease (RuvC/YqgF family)